jgi:RNA polymerase sigma-70 factor (ECF subfamily)
MNESLPRFEDLIEAHHDEIYRYLWRLLDGGNRSNASVEAHDLTQEVFMRAYRAYGRLRPGSNVRAWLYKIATNCAYTALERDRRTSGQDMALDDEHDVLADEVDGRPEAQFIAGESIEAVRKAIGGLPTKQRAALVMRYVQELEYEQIADALGCSEDSARANVYQAVKRLRVVLTEQV